LERGGITRADYLAGTPLGGARGHGRAPEHPTFQRKLTGEDKAMLSALFPDFDKKNAHTREELARNWKIYMNRKVFGDDIEDKELGTHMSQRRRSAQQYLMGVWEMDNHADNTAYWDQFKSDYAARWNKDAA
jgi:hypothetical protein